MCGIALVVELGMGGLSMLETLATMHADLATRGPDGAGFLVVDAELTPYRSEHPPAAAGVGGHALRLGAAFRRLAIRDLRPEAAQPLARRNGSIWVLHNGEIYNDGELRAELSARGVTFATGNDAETIAAAYEVWGERCFERLRGMWAVVIVDLEQGRLTVCRDRLGIKPLFLATDGSRLLLASYPRTIARALSSGPRVDHARWSRFLRGLPADSTQGGFFAGITAVPAGTLFTVDLRAPSALVPAFRRYWSLSDCLPDPGDRRHDATTEDELLHLLEASTEEHLVADRQVGCLLSGGLDSSIITVLASRAAKRQGQAPMAFSIVFDDPRMSEWPYIQSVAAHAGVKAVSHRLTPAEAWTLVDEVVAAHGEPLLGQDAIAHYRAFRLAHDHGCVVALEGQGADELFAGLPSYEAVMFLEWLGEGAWPTVYREARLRATLSGRPLASVLRQYVLGPIRRRWSAPRRHDAWLEPGPPAPVTRSAPDGPMERSSDPSRLNRYLFDLVRHTNLPAVLLIQDRNAMAHGVENRPPFLDHRIVEWAFRQPASAKVGNGRRKRVLWNVARRLVPPVVSARTDKRAIISRNDWMTLRPSHHDALADMAASPTLRSAPFIRGDRMASFVHGYLRGEHDDGMAVWRLYTGWRWLERFRPAS